MARGLTATLRSTGITTRTTRTALIPTATTREGLASSRDVPVGSSAPRKLRRRFKKTRQAGLRLARPPRRRPPSSARRRKLRRRRKALSRKRILPRHTFRSAPSKLSRAVGVRALIPRLCSPSSRTYRSLPSSSDLASRSQYSCTLSRPSSICSVTLTTTWRRPRGGPRRQTWKELATSLATKRRVGRWDRSRQRTRNSTTT
mmetsp:Transcript_29928/g.71158  ORF Transcript_29928/g.71158 Transcript_29928/m.71158 type:complete len:202 (+) Transcript_29928:812-1417(+)